MSSKIVKIQALLKAVVCIKNDISKQKRYDFVVYSDPVFPL